MVKLSIVFGVLALAATANATCSDTIQKCATDYAASAGSAGGDVSKICGGLKTYKDCVVAAKDACTGDVEKQVYDAAVKAMEQVESSMGSTCAGGGGSGGGSGSGCDMTKAAAACKDPIAKFTEFGQSAASMMQDFTFKAFNDYCANGLTVIGAYTKCAAGNGCGDDATKASATLKEGVETTCKAGPTPNAWMAAAMKDEAFAKCMGDDKPAEGATPTCDQAKKMYECGKDFPAGTALNEACEAFKTAGEGCDLTCPKASTSAAADSSPAYAGDTGAASTAQISASVVIAAVAFAGLAN